MPELHRGDVPPAAKVVIVGGGVMGVSTAFHLAEAGVKDIVLLEQHDLGSGSTSKAAGGIRAQFSDQLNIELGARSLTAFERFAQHPGQEIDLRRVGYLFLLDQPDMVATFERSVALQNELGVGSRMITPREAQALSPFISTEGLLAASFSPDDGHCSPESVVLGYATAARRLGATLITHNPVTGIELKGGDIAAVVTPGGRIRTDTVICAAGAWSSRIGAMAGVDLPVTPLRRQILITEPVSDAPPNLPMTIDFSSTFYFHGEGKGLLIGMSDPDETPGFLTDRSDAWLPRLGEVISRRAPRLETVGLAGGWAGLYEMTPDHNALVGESSAVSRLLYATGFSGHGFLMGPAIGEVMRDLYLQREPVVDISPLSADRFERGTRPEVNIV